MLFQQLKNVSKWVYDFFLNNKIAEAEERFWFNESNQK
jgi:hypothetical protein